MMIMGTILRRRGGIVDDTSPPVLEDEESDGEIEELGCSSLSSLFFSLDSPVLQSGFSIPYPPHFYPLPPLMRARAYGVLASNFSFVSS
jgi:hypothetical protein